MADTRIVFFDIESTDLRAPFGNVICCSFVELGDDTITTFRLDDKKYRGKVQEDDSKLVRKIKEYLEGSFIWVGWNSKDFDIPMLNARLILSGQAPIEKRMHIDLMWYAKRPMTRFYSARLDAIAKTFQLKTQKTDLDPNVWIKAKRLDKGAMDYVVEHCEHDILVLKEAFKIFSPVIKNIHV